MGSFTFCLVWTAPINTTIITSYHGRLAEQSSYPLIGWGTWDSSQAVQISPTSTSVIFCIAMRKLNPADIRAGGFTVLRQGLLLREGKHRCQRVRNAVFLLHLPPTRCLTFCCSGFDMIALSIRWVWRCGLLKSSACSLPCPLSSYPKMTVYKCRGKRRHDLLPALLLRSWKQNTYSRSNSTWGNHRVWETSAQKVEVCRSYKRVTRGGTMESVRQPE